MTETVTAKQKKNLEWAPGWVVASRVLGLSLLMQGVVFGSTYLDIVIIWWRSETYAHGFLILPIVAYLLWLKRVELASISPRPYPGAAVLVLIPALFWLVGFVAQVAVVEQLSVVLMLPIMTWAILGSGVTRRILFPLAYLFFAVPVGDFLVAPLQDVTANFTVWALQLTGIPVYLEGRFFYIPSGSFEVAEACSGVRYLIASVALGTLYAYLNFISLKRRLIFIALSILVPIIANGMRAYGIVMMAHMSDYSLAVGADHLVYGWLFFGVVIMLLFWGGSFFREEPPVTDNALNPFNALSMSSHAEVKAFVLWALVATSAAVSAPGFAVWLDARIAALPPVDISIPSVNINGWSGPFDVNTEWNPSFFGAQEQKVEYWKNGKSVQVYLAYYPRHIKDVELINWHNVVFDHQKSRRLSDGVFQVALRGGRSWSVLSTQLETNGQERLVWLWYEIDGSATINRVWAKAYALRSRLSGSHVGSAAWVISTEYSMNADEARTVLKDFLSDMLPQMREAVNR